jgi:hypothetical protein
MRVPYPANVKDTSGKPDAVQPVALIGFYGDDADVRPIPVEIVGGGGTGGGGGGQTDGLTDEQLRAAPVPVSGPATDEQLRATPLPVATGGLTDTQLRATPVAVAGPVTDAQLRASAIPVSGPATNAQLRATPLAVTLEGDDNDLLKSISDRLGAPDEAAPATDIAPSGIRAALKRVAQNITSLAAQLPATLGGKTAAASLAVTLASDDVLLGRLPATLGAKANASSLAVTLATDDVLLGRLPASLGAKTAAASLSVTTATDDLALARFGILTEVAPATDTASSGLNGRLQRIAQRLTSLIALVPASLGTKTAATSLAVTLASDEALLTRFPGSVGAKTAANSLAVTLATDDVLLGRLPASLGAKTAATSLAVTLATDDALLARQGDVVEAAPATDTASSGLNGRLQRIAQRLTSLIGQLPATLGVKTAANSLSIAPASDAIFNIASTTVLPAGTNKSGQATTVSGAFNLPANAARRGAVGQNTSGGTIGFNEFGGAAAIGQPGTYSVPSGSAFSISTNQLVNFVTAAGAANITLTEW